MLISKNKKTTIISQVILTVLALIFLFPVFVMFKISFQGKGIENYYKVLSLDYVYQFFFNSIIVSFFTVGLVFFLSLLAAYSLSKLNPIAKEKFGNEIVTEIKSAVQFYRAEEYHQKYFQKH